MRIKYSILWVDDSIDSFRDMELDKELERYLSDISFIPSIDMFDNIEDAEKKIREKRYDLIFSDFNINEDKNGEEFIENLRAKNVNCEVLFYSAMQDLPQNTIDRVSYFRLKTSSAYDELIAKMKALIDLTVEKLNDIVNLRGLVISEASELDDEMDEILTYYCAKYPEKGKEIIQDLQNKKEQELKRALSSDGTRCDKSCHLSVKDLAANDQIKSFDSSLKARGINKIIGIIGYTSIRNNFYEDYLNEIINNRNDLAHCVSVVENGKDVLKTRKGSHSFGIDEIKTIRANIIKFSNYFNLLRDKISK